MGAGHVCALAGASRGLYCWGEDSFGQLGTARLAETARPIPVTLLCQ